jgi:predicted Zn-dependent peptidase
MPSPARDPETVDADTHVATLGNGVRVVAVRQPHLESAAASVFVRAGSSHESRRLNGISHVVEHMAFKGTATRDVQAVNFDAERLGADVNAHTDKDHTAFHRRGRAADAAAFVAMLGDIVLRPTFPEEELERERQVLLQELLEDEEDPLSAAFTVFDRLCFGEHPLAQPVIGVRANLKRLTRADLQAHVARLYSGANLVVGVAGDVDPDAVVRAAESAFGGLERGSPNAIGEPTWKGGLAAKALAGSGQSHVVLGYPLPGLADPAHHAGLLAAALFGEGMSSPLLDALRERRGLAYYLSCSADVNALAGQFVVEASTAPEHLETLVAETDRLLAEQAGGVRAEDLERGRNMLDVRRLRNRESPSRRVEDAALDLLAFDRVRSRAEQKAAILDLDADDVAQAFASLRRSKVALAVSGTLRKGAFDRVRERMGAR